MDTVALLKHCMKTVALCIIILGPTMSLQGALKALQKQKIASKVLLTCYYCISLPVAYGLSVELEVGVTGLWTGMALGQLVIPLIYAYLFYNIDWRDVFELNRR